MKITLYNIKKGIRYLKHYGWKEFKIRLSEKREPDEISYIDWKQKHSVTQEELSRQKFLYKKWMAEGKAPLVSIVLNADKSECGEACKGTEPEDRLLASLEKQTYQNYEICRCFDKEVCKGESVGFQISQLLCRAGEYSQSRVDGEASLSSDRNGKDRWKKYGAVSDRTVIFRTNPA